MNELVLIPMIDPRIINNTILFLMVRLFFCVYFAHKGATSYLSHTHTSTRVCMCINLRGSPPSLYLEKNPFTTPKRLTPLCLISSSHMPNTFWRGCLTFIQDSKDTSIAVWLFLNKQEGPQSYLERKKNQFPGVKGSTSWAVVRWSWNKGQNIY